MAEGSGGGSPRTLYHAHILQLESEKERLRSHFGRELQTLEAALSAAEHGAHLRGLEHHFCSFLLASELQAAERGQRAAEEVARGGRAAESEWHA